MSKKKTEKTIKEKRIPIVAILGHVDHGKTTILDKIRKTDVQGCEAGGITQKISVFTVDPKGNNKDFITFIDTPGHEAFDLMRTRGGGIADIVLLIVAADDGVKPQTKESIEIIKKSEAKPIVVINKCDLPNVNIEKVKRDIVNNGIQIEGMGGKVPVIEVSGKTGKGIPELLDLINLVVEVEGLKEREKLPKEMLGRAFVLESVQEKSRGNVSTVVLTQGTFCKGEWLGYELNGDIHVERIKGLISEENKNLCELGTGCGGKILGLGNLLPLGIEVFVLENKDEKLLKKNIKEVKEKEEKTEEIEEGAEEMFDFFQENDEEKDVKVLKLIIKSSSEGALEAIEKALCEVNGDNCRVEIFHSGVGNITERDIEMASVSKAIVLGFEVGMETGVKELADKRKVVVRTYDIIYKLVEEIEDVVSMMGIEEENEEEVGNATVKVVFTLSDGTKVLGNKVNDGIMKRDCKCYIVRGDDIITEGKIKSLRIGKDTKVEAKKGEECGIILDVNVDEVKEGDKIYCNKVLR
jgi:translation initiation factor IF-2